LFWRLLPEKTFAFKGNQWYRGKRSKEQISLLFLRNFCFLLLESLQSLDVSMELSLFLFSTNLSKRHGWFSDIFMDWVKDLDCKFFQQKRKVLLFVDNCTAHPTVPDPNPSNWFFCH
jgi:hypothetical protein